jgi:hypothetical protein
MFIIVASSKRTSSLEVRAQAVIVNPKTPSQGKMRHLCRCCFSLEHFCSPLSAAPGSGDRRQAGCGVQINRLGPVGAGP